ncbi:MAG: hypothetical protein BGO76_07915 [Caedibacter sp. 38-128]|nr:MAG: hypothetical protein BGO76_07915 [Caedibacter sp. 38-128]
MILKCLRTPMTFSFRALSLASFLLFFLSSFVSEFFLSLFFGKLVLHEASEAPGILYQLKYMFQDGYVFWFL